MKLEYIHDTTDGGRYKQVVSENLVRLYDFGEEENIQLVQIIRDKIVNGNSSLALHELPFIEPINCRLTLDLGEKDTGIMRTSEENVFKCTLSLAGYESMMGMMRSPVMSQR